MATVTGSVGSPPCGACKFLRRKCTSDCVFAPYFSCEHGSTWFAAVHKVFGASNASKLLQHLPVHDRRHAVASIAFEAQARIKDPVYGCVAHIFSLQQQVTHLQAQLMQLKSQIPLASNLMETWSLENQWLGNCNAIVPGNQTVLSNSSNYQAHDFTTNDNQI